MNLFLRLALLAVPALLPSQAAKPVAIPMYLSKRRILVMLRIGENAPAPVVFDTGTDGNRLDTAFAKRLGLPKTGELNVIDGTTGLPVPNYETTVRDAKMGGVRIDDASAAVIDHGMEDEVGIFGPNCFPNRLVTLDFERSRILVEEKTPATIPKGASIPYAEIGLPQIPMEIAGKRIMGSLDTGNDAPLLLPLSLAKGLPLRGRLVEVGKAISAAGSQPVYKARLKGTIKIASVEIESPEVLFLKGGDPNVGLPIMRRLRLTFDPSGKRTWVLPKR